MDSIKQTEIKEKERTEYLEEEEKLSKPNSTAET